MPSGQSVTPGDLILVTGATGFIGSYIIDLLCKKGYRVRAVVRDINNQDNYKWLKDFEKQNGQLEFVQATFGVEYEKVVQGVHAVIHLASPYLYSAPDPQKDIVDPAIEGVTSMLAACSTAASTVKKVVLTSSGGAILHFPVSPGYVFSANDWNTTSSLTDNPYFYSKRLAEEAGWNLWREKYQSLFDFVVVNPLLVFGPIKNNKANASQSLLIKYFKGEIPSVQAGAVGVCDVRDVADSHLIALENTKATGQRLIVYSQTISWKEIVAEMKRQFPDAPVTPCQVDEHADWTMDTTSLRLLGKSSFAKFEDMLHDTIEAWIQFGLVPKPKE